MDIATTGTLFVIVVYLAGLGIGTLIGLFISKGGSNER